MKRSLLLVTVVLLNGLLCLPARPENTMVAGRVTSPDDQPVSGARLRIVGWDEGPRYSVETRSDTGGHFLLSAHPGKARLFVSADGFFAMYRTHDVAEGVNNGWDFRLVPSVRVSGRLLDTKGRPVPGRVLELGAVRREPPPAPGVEIAPTGPQGDMSGPDGSFNLENVAPGRYWINVYKRSPFGGDRTMEQTPVRGRLLEVKVPDGVPNHEIVVNPAADFFLAGHVRDRHGKPLSGVVVDAFIPHGRHWWAKTGSTGSFRLEGLDGMGTSRFKLHFNGLPGSESYKVAMADVPLNSPDIVFVDPGKGDLRGTVRDAKTGEPVRNPEIKVPVVKVPGSGAAWEAPLVRSTLDSSGTFTITGVPAGAATVEVRAEGLGVQRFPVLVEADATSTLACEMTGPAVLAGRTTIDGKPQGMAVVINGEWLNSGKDGTYRFDKFPNGAHTVWFFESETRLRTAEVNLRSGQTTRLDVDLGGSCSVRGKVRFPEDEPFCTIRLASRPASDGWYEFGRPVPEDYVLTYAIVRNSGGEYRLAGVPPGRYHLMAGRYRPAMHRSLLAFSREVDLREGQPLTLDLNLTTTEATAAPRRDPAQ